MLDPRIKESAPVYFILPDVYQMPENLFVTALT